tara:strand:- start:24 stop:491 length:468 start_codon:yes stop_codon:yes gene_type:complete
MVLKKGFDCLKFGYIREVGKMSKKGFTIIPNALILDEDLSNDSKVLFAYIKSLSENYRNLRNRTLRQKLGISLNTLQNCKNELIEKGYLTIYRRQSSNHYKLKLRQITQNKNNQNTQKLSNQNTQNFVSIKSKRTGINNTNRSKGRLKGFKKFNE